MEFPDCPVPDVNVGVDIDVIDVATEVWSLHTENLCVFSFRFLSFRFVSFRFVSTSTSTSTSTLTSTSASTWL